MSRRTVMAGVLAAVSLAAGCGISPTGVLDGGEPAVGFQPSIRLYFVSGARLRAVTRPVPWPSLKETLNLLVDGPSEEERRQGLRTELDPAMGRLDEVTSDGAKVRVSFLAPGPVRPSAVPASPMPSAPSQARPPDLSLGQLTCTAASALAARSNLDPDSVTVVIRRAGAAQDGSFRCSEFPRAPG